MAAPRLIINNTRKRLIITLYPFDLTHILHGKLIVEPHHYYHPTLLTVFSIQDPRSSQKSRRSVLIVTWNNLQYKGTFLHKYDICHRCSCSPITYSDELNNRTCSLTVRLPGSQKIKPLFSRISLALCLSLTPCYSC